MQLRKKHNSTLSKVFAEPTLTNIHWKDIESMLNALGADCSEGRGSRLRVKLNDARAVFHRPHPEKEASKSMVRSVRRFLEEAGMLPPEWVYKEYKEADFSIDGEVPIYEYFHKRRTWEDENE